jgi:DNA polymerase III epsilon subunit-like protein
MLNILDQEYVFLDLETTSVDTKTARIVELGYQISYMPFTKDIYCKSRYSQLINPQITIPPESSAAHQLRDEDVCNAPTIGEKLVEYLSAINNKIVVIHNADFDYSILKRVCSENNVEIHSTAVIDTLTFARKLLKDKLSSFTLGALFHYYKIPRGFDANFHRAEYDCIILSLIFKELVIEYIDKFKANNSLEDMFEYIYKVEVLDKITFGKYKGMMICDIPLDYMDWWLFKRSRSDSEQDNPLVDYTFSNEVLRRFPDHTFKSRILEIQGNAEFKLLNKSYPIKLAV